MANIFRRIAYLIGRRRRDADLAEEMEFHRSLSGSSAFGNATLAHEDARAIWISPSIESVTQDLRYAARSLWRDKAFTLVSLGALAAAIGLTTSLFSAFNGVMWRPWPVPDADRVVTLLGPAPQSAFSISEYAYLSASARTFDGLLISRCIDGVISACAVRVDDAAMNAEFVSRHYFDILRVALDRGAGLHLLDAPTGAAIAVLSDAAWRTRFNADPAIVGRVIRVDEVPFTVAGVVQPGFSGTQIDRKDIWIPIDAMPRLRPHYVFDDAKRFATISGRLAAGVTRAQAEAEIDTLSRQFHAGDGASRGRVRLTDATFLPAPGTRTRAVSVFGLMMLAVVLVLILACANVGNLLLARASARRREVAVRLAIGASRARILRQLLTECLLLSSIAVVPALALSYWLPGVILERLAGSVSFRLEPDARVFALSIAVALLTCLGFGLAPALAASRLRSPMASLGRREAHGPGVGVRLRSLLLAAQVAIAFVLLVNAGLLVRGVREVAVAEPGFDMRGVSVISFELPASYETARVRAFARHVLDDVTVRGTASAFADNAPFGVADRMWVSVRSGDHRSEDVLGVEVSASYFDTLGIPVLSGRGFARGEGRQAVLVNESMAREFWPGASPLGRVLTWNGERVVVGVVKDVRHYPFAPRTIFPTVYSPIDGRTVPQILVRRLDPGSVQAVAAFVRQLEPRVRVSVAPLARNLDDRLTRSRVGAGLASAVGVLGLLLAAVGVFSVFAYTVEQRRSEIGIRIALGARSAQIVRALLASNGVALAGGTVCGLAMSAATGRLVRGFLYGLSPLDPWAYGTVAATLAVAGVVATLAPARKATRIDPAVALRAE